MGPGLPARPGGPRGPGKPGAPATPASPWKHYSVYDDSSQICSTDYSREFLVLELTLAQCLYNNQTELNCAV